MDDATVTSPRIWPTKEELKGIQEEWEELTPPLRRRNYDSAEAFSETIKEEKETGGSGLLWVQTVRALSWPYGSHG